MFDAAEEMGIRFYGAPYLFSASDAKAGPDGVVNYAGDDAKPYGYLERRCTSLE